MPVDNTRRPALLQVQIIRTAPCRLGSSGLELSSGIVLSSAASQSTKSALAVPKRRGSSSRPRQIAHVAQSPCRSSRTTCAPRLGYGSGCSIVCGVCRVDVMMCRMLGEEAVGCWLCDASAISCIHIDQRSYTHPASRHKTQRVCPPASRRRLSVVSLPPARNGSTRTPERALY